MGADISVDNCPYHTTEAPNGWKARVSGEAKTVDQARKLCSCMTYADKCYWMEGWYKVNDILKKKKED